MADAVATAFVAVVAVADAVATTFVAEVAVAEAVVHVMDGGRARRGLRDRELLLLFWLFLFLLLYWFSKVALGIRQTLRRHLQLPWLLLLPLMLQRPSLIPCQCRLLRALNERFRKRLLIVETVVESSVTVVVGAYVRMVAADVCIAAVVRRAGGKGTKSSQSRIAVSLFVSRWREWRGRRDLRLDSVHHFLLQPKGKVTSHIG